MYSASILTPANIFDHLPCTLWAPAQCEIWNMDATRMINARKQVLSISWMKNISEYSKMKEVREQFQDTHCEWPINGKGNSLPGCQQVDEAPDDGNHKTNQCGVRKPLGGVVDSW